MYSHKQRQIKKRGLKAQLKLRLRRRFFSFRHLLQPSAPDEGNPELGLLLSGIHQHPRFQAMDVYSQSLYEIIHVTILPTLLRNYDRYSMASGLEIRKSILAIICEFFALATEHRHSCSFIYNWDQGETSLFQGVSPCVFQPLLASQTLLFLRIMKCQLQRKFLINRPWLILALQKKITRDLPRPILRINPPFALRDVIAPHV